MRPALVFCSLLYALPASADPYEEFIGVRSEAMGGAHRGVGTSNDAMLLNPAGLALFRRYSIDLVYGYSNQDDLSHLSFTALDSKTGPVAGAVGYVHDRGDHDGADVELHKIYVASAYPIIEMFSLGLLARHIRGHFDDEKGVRQDVESYSTDLGLSLLLFGRFGVGATYHNLIASSHDRMNPPAIAGGLSYMGDQLVLAADLYVDLREQHRGEPTVSAGLEYFLYEAIPVRAGLKVKPLVRKKTGAFEYETILTMGLGLVIESGAIEMSYTQSLVIKKNWDLVFALKFFI